MLKAENIQQLQDWCEHNLDTSTFDGMYGAYQRVEAKAEELGVPVKLRWEQAPAWHPTLQRFEGAGTYPELVIEVLHATAE